MPRDTRQWVGGFRRASVRVADIPEVQAAQERARKEAKMSAEDQLQDVATKWVNSITEVQEAETAFRDAQGKLEHLKKRKVELAENLKKRCANQIAGGGRVVIITSAAKSGAIAVESGRVVELAEDEVVGLTPENGGKSD